MSTFLLLLIYSFNSFSWTPEAVSKWDKTNLNYPKEMETSTFATFWGGVRRGIHLPNHQGKMIPLKLSGFVKELPVYLQYKSTKRDLIVFYPGVFGKPDGKITPQVIDELEKRDVHIAVIPNLLATTYLSARPKANGDPIEFERNNQQIIFSEIIKIINPVNIQKIHVIAESLGCIQALTAMTPPTPQKIDSLTLLWPPLHLNRAIERFDVLIQKSLSHQTTCSYWWKWPKVVYATKGQTLPTALSKEEKNCLGSWVIGSGFVDSIRGTAEEVPQSSPIPAAELPMTFTDFVKKITPEMLSYMKNQDPRLSVDFLLKSYKTESTKIKMASSVDDFLNNPQEWETLKANHPDFKSNIYLFSWGGHSGPIGMDDFIESVLNQTL